MNRLLAALMLMLSVTSTPVFAGGNNQGGNNEGEDNGRGHEHQVPEIDPGAGLAAMAAVGAGLVLIGERRRRNDKR